MSAFFKCNLEHSNVLCVSFVPRDPIWSHFFHLVLLEIINVIFAVLIDLKTSGSRPEVQNLQNWRPQAQSAHGQRDLLYISNSAGEDGPQKLPMTAVAGQITATGVWRLNKQAWVPILNVLFLECNNFYFESRCLHFCLSSARLSLQDVFCCWCLPRGTSCVCKSGRKGFSVFPVHDLHDFGWEHCGSLQIF